MIYAIVISVVLHIAAFALFIFGGGISKKPAYPAIMKVNLVSLPPISKGVTAGVESPGETKAKSSTSKLQSKVEKTPDTPHMAEVEPRKKQNPKKKNTTPAKKNDTNNNKPAEKKGEGEDRIGLPDGVETGSEFGTVQLDGASFETPTYLNILFAKIKYRWNNPIESSEEINCVVYFTILQNGKVVDAVVENSSGYAAFDQSALRAVLESSPPPLPLEYSGNQLGVHLQFQYIP